MNKTTRRDFLRLSGFGAALAALAACKATQPSGVGSPDPTQTEIIPGSTGSAPDSTPAPASSQADLPGDENWRIFQTLKRITFGPTQEEIDRAHQIGLDAFIEEQLNPDSIDDSHMEPILAEFSTLRMEAVDLIALDEPSLPVQELIGATLLRALHSRRQLFELTVDFWSNHFNIFLLGVPERIFKPQDDRDVIRQYAFGKFYDLLSASAHSPAMLTYLDQARSNKNAPNENYARELLELHTLGVDGGYTQLDVQESARILTGWKVGGLRTPDSAGKFFFAGHLHDQDQKSVLGYQFPAGGGEEEGQRLLQILAEHPSTARFISTKLVRRFVSDQPPQDLVAEAARTFEATGGDIRQVLRTILLSESFQLSLGTKFSRPFEYLISALRATGTQPGNRRLFGEFLRQMGQPLFQWLNPDGFPDEAAAWQSTGGMLARWNYALYVAFGDQRGRNRVDWSALTGPTAGAEGAIDALWGRLVSDPLDAPARQVLLDFAGSLPAELVAPGIGALILASPYFQYR